MAKVMITCPLTGNPVFTGIEMNINYFERLTFKNKTCKCHECGQLHVWNKTNAYLEEEED